MDITSLVSEFERTTKAKVIFATKKIGHLGAMYWPELVSDDLVFVSLAQGSKVLTQHVLDRPIRSYSFEIWFEISGWSQQPHLSKERIAMLLADNYMIDPVFKDLIAKMLKNKNITTKLSRRRPTHLMHHFELPKVKLCLAEILFSHWFEEHPKSLPSDMAQLININSVPLEIKACMTIMNSIEEELSETDKQFTTQAILHYHSVNDGLWDLSGVDISEGEYAHIRNTLYATYKGVRC